MARLTKEAALEKIEKTREVEVPGRGGSVLIRPLTRAEIHSNSTDNNKKLTAEEVEARTLMFGCVDPEFDINEARDVLKTWNAGDVQVVMEAIMDFSGYGEDKVNEAYERFRDRS